ncbi:hypothetical protein [Brevibacillus sedimenti]|uniref:hypothetical protein n=1 Tax=Brevibacillus sedimenti TaxID=2613334 RepID=UPI001E52DA65|nr:hypothetical protein [Anoxybacillus sediminis]UFJ62711.1 restriction endonuclease [Anoxybacillus sediminis]
MKPVLTISDLIAKAEEFCKLESQKQNPSLYGITDGKAVGTYVEHSFQQFLQESFTIEIGSSARGIDLPSESINTDIKVTSIKQPQSSCPFKSPREKIYGLGYNLLLFVYDKKDDPSTQTTTLDFVSCAFIDKSRTGDYQTTRGIRQILENDGNIDDLIAYFYDRALPGDEIIYQGLAEEILSNPPEQGYLTISNALQWRLQYKRIVDLPKNKVDGIVKII